MPDESGKDVSVPEITEVGQRIQVSDFSLEMNRFFRQFMDKPEPESKSELSIRDFIYLIFRHKWKIAAMFILCVAADVYYLSGIPNHYESTAKILIRSDRTPLSVDPSGEGNSFLKRGGGVPSETVRSEIGIIQNFNIAEGVVNQLGEERVLGIAGRPKPAARTEQPAKRGGLSAVIDQGMKLLNVSTPKLTLREAAILTVQSNLTVEPTMGGSSVLQLTYTASDPKLARDILLTYLDLYLDEHIEIQKSRVSPEFFRVKLEELKGKIADGEIALMKFQKSLNVDSLPNQEAILTSQMVPLQINLLETTARVASTRMRIDRAEQKLEELARKKRPAAATSAPAEDEVDPMVTHLRDRLTEVRMRDHLIELKIREETLKLTFTDRAPQLIAVRKEIDHLEKTLNDSARMPPTVMAASDPYAQELERQLEGLQIDLQSELGHQQALEANLQGIRTELDKYGAHKNDIQRMQSELEIVRVEYRQYLNSLQAAEISEALDRDKITNVRVVQTPTLPIQPTKSQRKIMTLLAFGIFMGLGAGLGLAFMCDFLNHTVKTLDDVERKIGLPVLVALPRIRNYQLRIHEEEAA